ncbi:hypothetical protein CC86DRAFT_113311 [Ophiobolus disseminans]|uniref:Uncharacterized protein n=1 Tax=Ophiobolus disseminans TaxID=1469910 RepID=A0A6A6ZL30_9PLEO|nr:hypothetical protein CC86DRAFT_113311 [Ophiobolus disseminans]
MPPSVTQSTTSHKPRHCSQALRSNHPMVGPWRRRFRSASGWRQVCARRRIWPGVRYIPAKRDIPSLDKAIDVASASARATSPSDCLPDLSALIEPGVTIIGPEHKVYYGFLSTPVVSDNPGSGTVSVLGHDERLPLLMTQTVQGIFQLARLCGDILEYGMDEGVEGFWGAFLGPVLEGVTHVGKGAMGWW